MKRYPFLSLWTLYLLVLGACAPAPPDQVPLGFGASYFQANGLTFDSMHVEHSSEPCELPKGPCAKVVVRYPVAEHGPAKTVAFLNDSISQYVRLTLTVFGSPNTPIVPDLDSLARRFIQEYEQFRRDNPDYSAPPWRLETKGRILFQNERLLSVELDNFSYTGGAHPNSFRILLTMDLERRQMLQPADFIAKEEPFRDLVEQAFRDFHGLGAEASLNEAGFFWDQPFSIPENIAFTPTGLRVVYNPYEVAPYALGATELNIPYAKLEGMLVEAYR